eukprot:scaffold5398_cov120-Cylindrotheca_fusiformis.AAC.5
MYSHKCHNFFLSDALRVYECTAVHISSWNIIFAFKGHTSYLSGMSRYLTSSSCGGLISEFRNRSGTKQLSQHEDNKSGGKAP